MRRGVQTRIPVSTAYQFMGADLCSSHPIRECIKIVDNLKHRMYFPGHNISRLKLLTALQQSFPGHFKYSPLPHQAHLFQTNIKTVRKLSLSTFPFSVSEIRHFFSRCHFRDYPASSDNNPGDIYRYQIAYCCCMQEDTSGHKT
jgi:hypothetical protein